MMNMMNRVAIFVDAGYLFAQGAAALVGAPLPRSSVDLNQSAAVDKLLEVARDKAGDSSLLRVYWYDGVLRQGPTPEQERIADADDVKLRLGFVSFAGQQKGVDSLIVTDLIELSRNQAISDAVLLSGDEDVRVGVQIAQLYGVRIHLIGIEPSSESQSRRLMQESDTTTEWSRSDIGEILTIRRDADASAAPESLGNADKLEIDSATAVSLNEVTNSLVESLTPEGLNLVASLRAREAVPQEYDRLLLIRGSEAIGSPLNTRARIYIRDRFKSLARSRLADASP